MYRTLESLCPVTWRELRLGSYQTQISKFTFVNPIGYQAQSNFLISCVSQLWYSQILIGKFSGMQKLLPRKKKGCKNGNNAPSTGCYGQWPYLKIYGPDYHTVGSQSSKLMLSTKVLIVRWRAMRTQHVAPLRSTLWWPLWIMQVLFSLPLSVNSEMDQRTPHTLTLITVFKNKKQDRVIPRYLHPQWRYMRAYSSTNCRQARITFLGPFGWRYTDNCNPHSPGTRMRGKQIMLSGLGPPPQTETFSRPHYRTVHCYDLYYWIYCRYRCIIYVTHHSHSLSCCDGICCS